jgi:hypothetical protein
MAELDPIKRVKADRGPIEPREVSVTMKRTQDVPTPDQLLWVVIRNRTNGISFNNYKNFMDGLMCGKGGDLRKQSGKAKDKEELLDALEVNIRAKTLDHFHGLDGYLLLKKATELFLMQECGVFIKDTSPFHVADETSRLGYEIAVEKGETDADEVNSELKDRYLESLPQVFGSDLKVLPYLNLIVSRLSDLPLKTSGHPSNCYGILPSRIAEPCLLELIWSYWHEEAMLVQTLNVISKRFQNVRIPGKDPMSRLDIAPLRPLNNLFWGYIQDEMFRLTVVRRAYEYDHQYGLQLLGKAAPPLQSMDSRSKFLESFHHLLNLCSIFFKEDDDTTVIADGFPLLNALKDVHLLLAEGAQNQFGDLPWTARVEMMIQQWLLARPELREFLGGKTMVPYTEAWMDRVDTVKSMQGWSDVNVMHFRDLGVFGEQILLSIRYGAWTTLFDPIHAANWARYWRPEIQGYIHAYRAATGIDLTGEPVNSTIPGILLRNRLVAQQKVAR